MYTTVYPTAIPNRTNLPVWVDDVDDVEALVVNDPVTELLACLTHLGTMPAGSAADLTTRLAVSLNDDGSLKSTLSPTFVDLTLSGDLAVNGNDITSTGDLTLNPTGGNVIVDGNLGVQKTVPQAEGHFYGAGHCGIIIENEGADGQGGIELESSLPIMNVGINTGRAIIEKGTNAVGMWTRLDARAAQLRYTWFYEAAGSNTETSVMVLKVDTGDFSLLTGNLYIDNAGFARYRSSDNAEYGQLQMGDNDFTISTGGTNDRNIILTPAASVVINNGLVIPSGTTPAPASEGALYLDTDAGANGTLVMYSNSAWRTIVAW